MDILLYQYLISLLCETMLLQGCLFGAFLNSMHFLVDPYYQVLVYFLFYMLIVPVPNAYGIEYPYGIKQCIQFSYYVNFAFVGCYTHP